MTMTEKEIRKIVQLTSVATYFPKEYEQMKKTGFDPAPATLFNASLPENQEKHSDQQKAVLSIGPILAEQLSTVKNITPSEVEAAAKKTFEWAAKSSKQVNETFEKMKGIVDRITKVHTNEIRATISLQIQDVRKEYFTEQKKKVH